MTISMDKKYRTRDGRDVRLLCVDRAGDFPVVGIITESNSLTAWKSDGKAYTAGPSDYDLIEVRPRIKRDVWVNVYPDPGKGSLYASRASADRMFCNDRIACVKLTIYCEEGEGL